MDLLLLLQHFRGVGMGGGRETWLRTLPNLAWLIGTNLWEWSTDLGSAYNYGYLYALTWSGILTSDLQ